MPEQPTWLADEMLGRLARYLRFCGFDTLYLRGLPDDLVMARARAEARVLLTRDVRLARRFAPSVLITRTDLPGQLGEVRRAVPDVRWVVRFDRCTLCNGALREVGAPTEAPTGSGARTQPSNERPEYSCAVCGHRYWEGTHTDRIRRDLAAWVGAGGPT